MATAADVDHPASQPRLGPGHLGAIVSIDAFGKRDAAYYRDRLGQLPSISHLTVEALPTG